MGRAPCCDKAHVKKGPWSPEEDSKLKQFIEKHGTGGNWIALPQKAGLRRCGKSCRLRWLNYLRPNIKHGEFSAEEDRMICTLFASIGSRWSIIAASLPGRTDNDIKNYWNAKLKKKLLGIPPPHRKYRSKHQQAQYQQREQDHHLQQRLAPSHLILDVASSSYLQEQEPLLNNEGFPTTTNDLLRNVTIGDSLHIPLHQQYQITTCSSPSTTFLAFGGEPCSSNGLGYAYRDCAQIGIGQEMIGFESVAYARGFQDQNQKPLLPKLGLTGEGGHDGIWLGATLDYGYEEIKELISLNNGFSNFFMDDVNNTSRRCSESQGMPLYFS